MLRGNSACGSCDSARSSASIYQSGTDSSPATLRSYSSSSASAHESTSSGEAGVVRASSASGPRAGSSVCGTAGVVPVALIASTKSASKLTAASSEGDSNHEGRSSGAVGVAISSLNAGVVDKVGAPGCPIDACNQAGNSDAGSAGAKLSGAQILFQVHPGWFKVTSRTLNP